MLLQLLGKTQGSNGPGTFALVQSFLSAKAAKEEEKKKLSQQHKDLQTQQKNLEIKIKELSSAVTVGRLF
jgi:hypothetical protein